MINIIKIKCPHCGVEGQLVLPESDALIIGPCPECNNTVVIFAGKALALDKEFLTRATKEEAYNHLYGVLEGLVREKLDKVFNSAFPAAPLDSPQEDADALEDETRDESPDISTLSNASDTSAISAGELHAFIQEELPLLDNRDYFKAIFG